MLQEDVIYKNNNTNFPYTDFVSCIFKFVQKIGQSVTENNDNKIYYTGTIITTKPLYKRNVALGQIRHARKPV